MVCRTKIIVVINVNNAIITKNKTIYNILNIIGCSAEQICIVSSTNVLLPVEIVFVQVIGAVHDAGILIGLYADGLLEHNEYEVVAHGIGLLIHAQFILLDPTHAWATVVSHASDGFPIQPLIDDIADPENGVVIIYCDYIIKKSTFL